jgi:adenylate cyclase
MVALRPKISGIFVGLLVTALTTLSFSAIPALDELELSLFDFRIRRFNDLKPTTPIVHLDIDDGSLEEVARWPWSRETLADLLRALNDLKPSRVMIDLLLSEREKPLIEDPRFGPDWDLEGQSKVVGELTDANVSFGDLELADAIAPAGNVILATQFDVTSGGFSSSSQQAASVQSALRRRAVEKLTLNYALDLPALAQAIGAPVAEVADVWAGAKSQAADAVVSRMFRGGATPTLREVLSTVLGERAERLDEDRADVVEAYRTCMGLARLDADSPAIDPELSLNLSRAERPIPPYFRIGNASRGLAAVNFSTDRDGRVRRVPIAVVSEGRLVPHMGLRAAADILDLDLSKARWLAGRLEIPARGAQGEGRSIPLDGAGNMIIPWTSTAPRWRRGDDFPHIPAAKLWTIADAKRKIANNQTAIDYLFAQVVAASKGEVTLEGNASSQATKVGADSAFRKSVNELVALRNEVRMARLLGGVAAEKIAEMQGRCDDLAQQIGKEQEQAAGMVKLNHAEMAAITNEELEADPQLRKDVERFTKAKAVLDNDIGALKQANEKLKALIAATTAELGPKITGKHVFLGYAATALGDIVSTPIDSSTNGVMCHAHVLNALLQNRFIVVADRRLGLGLCLLLGAATTLITGTRPPRQAFLITLAIALIYFYVNSTALFGSRHIWLMLAAPLVTASITWAFVTLFRQLTAEREKRLFSKQLGQYTSPIIAAKIAESPEAAAAFKKVQSRDVTCFFSDLAGFTSISEQQSPEVVQHVLNIYLESMSRVIWSQRGLINKFMGDGIMAFFNPSVDPLPTHALAACETALLTFEALEKLKGERAGDYAVDIFKMLSMRVGIATGTAKNGDMGSELKADYTVIGDVVNLAARLEPANKVFGTQIMISGATHEIVKDAFEFRYLAELQVKGKASTVPVYEIVCRRGQLTEDQRSYIERFEAGIELYKQRKWDECIVHFTRIISRKFDDAGASRYIDACQEFKQFPPEADWCGALELTEK